MIYECNYLNFQKKWIKNIQITKQRISVMNSNTFTIKKKFVKSTLMDANF